MKPSTVMLAIANKGGLTADDVINNGTGSLIDTGSGEFLVTNHHVYEKFRSDREKDAETTLLMSGAHGTTFLDISKAEVRGLDKYLDLAVLHIPHRYILQQGKMFRMCHRWPPRRPEEGMMGLIYGYPGEGRISQGAILGARANSMVLRVASSRNENRFMLAHDNSDAELLIPEGANSLTSLGGMSGSAVYVMTKETETTKAELFLGGFMSEASKSIESMMIYATYADHINPDGTIR